MVLGAVAEGTGQDTLWGADPRVLRDNLCSAARN